MIEINITLIIQACNFGIAYICIRQLLLKPAITYILHAHMQRQELVASVEKKRLLVTHEEQRKKEQWEAWQKEFAARAPRICVEPLKHEHLPSSTFAKPSAEQIKNVSDSVASALVARVNHVQ